MPLPIGTFPANVLVIGEGLLGQVQLFGRELQIGRNPSCEILLQRNTVAGRHARLVDRVEKGYWIEDMLSANGTFVNGKRIRFEPLVVGDLIQLGGMSLRFEHQVSAGQPPPDAVPHDEEARLVLADALSERGDPKGEFIAFQTLAEKLPHGDPRRAELATRAQVLLGRHEQAWVAPLPVFVEDWRFRHGGLAAVRLLPARFLHDPQVDELLAAHPIRAVAFVPGAVDEAILRRIEASPRLEKLGQVELPRGMTSDALERRFGGADGVYGPETPYWQRYEMS